MLSTISRSGAAAPRMLLLLCSTATAAAHATTARAVSAARLSVHEHHAQSLMRTYGIPVVDGSAAFDPSEAGTVTEKLGGKSVVKSQVLAGGRGQGHLSSGLQGGVHLVDSPQEATRVAEKMLGHTLFTRQTGAKGRPVNALYVTKQVRVLNEMYLSILMDRATAGPVVIASAEGGMSIEELAVDKPDAVLTLPVSLNGAAAPGEPVMAPHDVETLTDHLQLWDAAGRAQFANLIQNAARLFSEKDITMFEVNPLARTESTATPEGDVVCLDAKITFDDNAGFRQHDVFQLRDVLQEDAREVAAAKWDINYIGLDGNIGCLVNGAGLAMATMDIVSLYGGTPANFLDVGGSASIEQVRNAMHLVRKDPQVKGIFVNIFGGIMRCDVIAQGVIEDLRSIPEGGAVPPVIMRLQGTNVDEACKLVAECDLPITLIDDLDDAARRAVEATSAA